MIEPCEEGSCGESEELCEGGVVLISEVGIAEVPGPIAALSAIVGDGDETVGCG